VTGSFIGEGATSKLDYTLEIQVSED
jgi:hypothetical protein